MIQGHFEAQKNGFRQTSKGFVVSLLIHPNDISPSFVAAPTGTRFQVGYAEMDDNELPASYPPAVDDPEEKGGGDEVTSEIATADF